MHRALVLLLSCGTQAYTASNQPIEAPAPAPHTAPAPTEEPRSAVQPTAIVSSPTTLREAARGAGVSWPPPDLALRIDKSERTLVVFSGDRALKQYRVGLGGAPSGDKSQEGDQRTPNGEFTIVTRNDRSQFHLFLGISYPNAEDAARGRRDRLVTERQARAIETAIAAGRQPPWSTPLGGAIGIHGGGGGGDWTLGCIAVENTEIEEIWEVGSLGTPVTIVE